MFRELTSLLVKYPLIVMRKLSVSNFKKLHFAIQTEAKEDVIQNIKVYFGIASKPINVQREKEFKATRDENYLKTHQDSLDFSNTSNNRDTFISKNVCIIGELDIPQCKKYRVFQKLEFFHNNNITSNYCHWGDQPRAINILQTASSLILYRVPSNDLVKGYIDEAYRLGINIFYDIDDPIFDFDAYDANTNLHYVDENVKKGIMNAIPSYADMIRKVPNIIVSTPGMKLLVEKLTNNPVFVWRNMVDSETQNAVHHFNSTKGQDKISETFTINYMSGSLAHEADFKVVFDALVKILNKYEKTRLRIVGHSKLSTELLDKFPSQVEIFSFTDYYSYIMLFRDSELNIIPLVQDAFNDCKSAIRFYEASTLGITTMVSNIGDFKEIIDNNVDGILVENENWFEALESYYLNKVENRKIGLNAKHLVEKSYLLESLIGNLSPKLMKML